MQTGSSSSRPPGEPPKSVQPTAKETKKIEAKRCSTMFSKRQDGIQKKLCRLNQLTGARVAVIMFSPTGKLKSFGRPSVEEVMLDYRKSHNPAMLPTRRRERVEECDSCATKEDCASPIADRKRRCNTFSKRYPTIQKKVCELNELTGTRVAVIMFSPAGKLKSCGKPSVEEVILDYDGHVMPPTRRRERAEECDSCATKEDCASLIMKRVEAEDGLLQMWEDFENNPSFNAGAGHDYEVSYNDEIRPLLERLEDPSHSLWAHFENYAHNGDRDRCSTLLINLATAEVISGEESNPTRSEPEGCGFDIDTLSVTVWTWPLMVEAQERSPWPLILRAMVIAFEDLDVSLGILT